MKFSSRGTPEFWQLYHELPADVRVVARKIYRLWRMDALHPSLHFKKVGGRKWSIRVGIHYRAIGKFDGDGFVWDWIGTHAEYDRLV